MFFPGLEIASCAQTTYTDRRSFTAAGMHPPPVQPWLTQDAEWRKTHSWLLLIPESLFWP